MTVSTDRSREHTASEVLRRIDNDTIVKLRECVDAPVSVAERLSALDHEWDLDRVIETEASVVGLIGLGLGLAVRREFLVIPLMVGGAVLLYALTGRYPLLPLFRRLGVRTAGEIARERYSLKALRGDFALHSKNGSRGGADDQFAPPMSEGASPSLAGSRPQVQVENGTR
jgi:hypothetical protein